MELNENSRFTLVAMRRDCPTLLIQMDVPWERLLDDVVTPFDSGDPFFVDGAPMKSTEIDRLKIPC